MIYIICCFVFKFMRIYLILFLGGVCFFLLCMFFLNCIFSLFMCLVFCGFWVLMKCMKLFSFMVLLSFFSGCLVMCWVRMKCLLEVCSMEYLCDLVCLFRCLMVLVVWVDFIIGFFVVWVVSIWCWFSVLFCNLFL